MDIGLIGLGRMGGNMARRLMRGGHQVVASDRRAESVEEFVAEGAEGATSVAQVAAALPSPRVAWVMVPAGDPTEKVVMELGATMSKGDIVIDGGNTWFQDDIRRAQALRE